MYLFFPGAVDARECFLVYYVALAPVGYSSGQRGQTVNLLAYAFQGSNPCPTTIHEAGVRVEYLHSDVDAIERV